MSMDWDKLRIFQAVADAGSFTHAGEALKLSQSAISPPDRRARGAARRHRCSTAMPAA